jgi:predicted lipoprotein with Yx(FWY)xxD motif
MVLALCGTALVATACSSGPPPPPKFQAGPTYMVQAAKVGGLGRILVDGQGITLYMFTLDHPYRPSVCYQFCAVEWPPLTLPSGVDHPLAGPGVRASLLGTTRRTNGQLQVTYAGWPLYLWYGDTVPGSTSGQALANAGGLWYVLRPSGQIVR